MVAIGNTEAATLERIDTSRQGERYRVEMKLVAAIPEGFAREILESPERVVEVSEELVGVEYLPSSVPGVRRFRDHTRTCIWLFCVDYHNTIDMRLLANGDIQLTVDPDKSEFKYGVFTWRTRALNVNQTQLSFVSESTPGFWIPSVRLLESKMRRGIQRMVRRMECEYHQDKICSDVQAVDSTGNNGQ